MRKWKDKSMIIILIVVLSIVVMAVLFVVNGKDKGETIVIERNSYGEGDKTVSVYLDGEDVLTFQVGEQEYSPEDLEEAFLEGFRWARENMLLENSSASEIRTSLNFMSEVPGGIQAEWLVDDSGLVLSDGSINNQGLEEEGAQLVRLSLTLSYGEEIRMEDIYVTVKAPVLSAEEKVKQGILDEIAQIEQATRNEESFTLPDKIDGVLLTKESKEGIWGYVLVGIAMIVFVIYRKKREETELVKQRKQQLMIDYPVFVNKVLLYLSAGLNLRAVFQRIWEDGEKNEKSKERYLHQEVFILLNQMKSGISEYAAYESFGQRIKESDYIRFSALVVQNIQKGNRGLIEALVQEEENAFANRIAEARKAGEEAGTKLLFPMLLLLIVVMMIIMAPAVLQFQNY